MAEGTTRDDTGGDDLLGKIRKLNQKSFTQTMEINEINKECDKQIELAAIEISNKQKHSDDVLLQLTDKLKSAQDKRIKIISSIP